MALLKSTNPRELERPTYALWLHIFALRSNFVETEVNHLWTTSEFSLVVPSKPGEPFDVSTYDEDDDDDGANDTKSSVDSRIKDPDYLPGNESIDKSFFSDISARPQSSTDDLTNMGLEGEIAMPRWPRSCKAQEEDIGGQDTGAVPHAPSRAPSPNNDPESQQRSGRRRTRILDFAVIYLEPDDEAPMIKVLHFRLKQFKAHNSPVLVEGKRAPGGSFTNDLKSLQKELNVLLGRAYMDFVNKSPYVFQVYSCASFIAIAFSGPYWCFAVCRPASPIIFSQAISVESDAHDIALQTILNAAESNPNDPGADEAMGRLVTQYSRKLQKFAEIIV
ncbi:hypothetical protein RSOL_355250, partial [Rhizoctonia solani AG-3 Rhs1AP]